jgi:hypothetical protein
VELRKNRTPSTVITASSIEEGIAKELFMISKWKLELLAFLTSLTLISVGFSSWQITSGPVLLSGTIQTSPVQKASEYITFDTTVGTNNTGITMFEYSGELGFIGSSATSYTQASVTLNYQINVDNCRGYNGFESFIMKDEELDGYELSYLQLNITVNLRDKQTGNYDTSTLGSFLNYAPINVSASYCSAVLNGSALAVNSDDFKAQVNGNVISFLFPLSAGTDGDGTNDTTDKIALTFNFVASSRDNAKSAAALLNGKEFSFQTAFKGLPSNEFSN